MSGKSITKEHLGQLLQKGKTGLIKGFTSKAGKSFDAHLVLKDGFKIGFESPKRKGAKK